MLMSIYLMMNIWSLNWRVSNSFSCHKKRTFIAKHIGPCWCGFATLPVARNPDHTRLHFFVKESTGQSWKPFETQSELNCSDLQHAFVSGNQRASLACASTVITLYTAKANATDKKRAQKKLIQHRPLTWGEPEGATLHAYRGGSNRVYDCIISPLPHHFSTHQWTLAATMAELTDQASLIHSPPRCLCQVIAGGKRKTDQYISHGPDR